MSVYSFTWNVPMFYSDYVQNGTYANCSILYKYRDWDNPLHKKLLTECGVYFASPSSFEDPLDCHAPYYFPSFYNLPSIYWQDVNRQMPHANVLKKLYCTVKGMALSPLLSDERKNEIRNKTDKMFYERFGVLCLTAFPNIESMWDIYSAHHCGFCIGYDTSILEKYTGGSGPVVYAKKLPPIMLFKDDLIVQHIKNVFFKQDKWSYEHEYRIQQVWDHKVSEKERYIHLPNTVIKEIILGKNMPQISKNEITAIASYKYPDAKIFNE